VRLYDHTNSAYIASATRVPYSQAKWGRTDIRLEEWSNIRPRQKAELERRVVVRLQHIAKPGALLLYPDELGEKGTLEETGVGKLVLWDVVSQHAQGSHVGLCMLFTFAAVASAYCVQTVVVIMFNYVI
jgi:hypothetical protein